MQTYALAQRVLENHDILEVHVHHHDMLKAKNEIESKNDRNICKITNKIWNGTSGCSTPEFDLANPPDSRWEEAPSPVLVKNHWRPTPAILCGYFQVLTL